MAAIIGTEVVAFLRVVLNAVSEYAGAPLAHTVNEMNAMC